jgi:hypothetical protein
VHSERTVHAAPVFSLWDTRRTLCHLTTRLDPSPTAQVEGWVSFDDKVESLHQWDKQIGAVCSSVNGILDAMAAAGIKVTL